jgi:hypothetical protein
LSATSFPVIPMWLGIQVRYVWVPDAFRAKRRFQMSRRIGVWVSLVVASIAWRAALFAVYF